MKMTLEEMLCDLYDKYGNDFNWYMVPFTPVSYTHLDVYKRQYYDFSRLTYL